MLSPDDAAIDGFVKTSNGKLRFCLSGFTHVAKLEPLLSSKLHYTFFFAPRLCLTEAESPGHACNVVPIP